MLDGVEYRSASDRVPERDPTGAGDAFDGVCWRPSPAACRAGAFVARSGATWPKAMA